MNKQVKYRNENGLHKPIITKEEHLKLVEIVNSKKINQIVKNAKVLSEELLKLGFNLIGYIFYTSVVVLLSVSGEFSLSSATFNSSSFLSSSFLFWTNCSFLDSKLLCYETIYTIICYSISVVHCMST